MALSDLELNSGTKMPIFGLGTWQSRDESAEAAIDCALENGYRLIDTAYVYGNEALVGKVLKKHFDSGKLKREDIFITTKLPNTANRPESVEKYLKKELASLGLDYVDLYLVHMPVGLVELSEDDLLPTDKETGMALFDPDSDHVKLWKAMEEQFEAGRAKAIGVSNFNIQQLQRILDNCKIPPANNQVEIHAYLQQPELVKFCADNKITVTSYATLGSPGRVDFHEALGLPKAEIPDLMENPVVVEIAEKHSKSPAQILLRFIMQSGIAVIPKSVTPARIKSNSEVFDFELSADEMASMKALDKGPKARGFTMVDIFKGIVDHPEFPFHDTLKA
ncbi:unnamed protein product [Notodromas monacha]|uniref:NADP-dependent oxidoreductase domain-containing protein n=1 Tax=Notodromas monacha TaxID=399045 RepID=A0A7R9GJ50_9CRUS|nr:unnamed protein product [Notodromas monacha]CAD7282999.1 unnamed protein product [Notodromas monacha]CAG0920665.1 unnamed protein product [Notodromas monacha]CAG0923151.1 unnamed protein product [Notodromas monacha]